MNIPRAAIRRRLKEKQNILNKAKDRGDGMAELTPAVRRRLLSDNAPSQGPERYSFQEK